ncbi:MAG: bis(5'-nucleosyl)-tetraphosphatase (symmetrical) YqeK [Candidatus Poribacteria bacterium]|nr:bis(5'-nucleosyl)-tetraphosphatase (symmetrical) YqeK [Candidatus Poribacteria bacterium]MDE0481135.1 bis(5'-nucleosyl)-tetraphosphatase (symmetrical) YqeK [Candidatus Poribacteria bacterium]
MTERKIFSVNSKSELSFSTLIELREHPKSIEIQRYLSEKLTPERLDHVFSVQETAVTLALRHNADVWKTNLAALLHDVAKWMSDDQLYTAVAHHEIELDPIEKIMPALLHAIVGVKCAIELFEITDLEILEAIRNHTTGNASMGLIAKLIYVADFAEPTREYKEAAQVRKLAEMELDQAVHNVAHYKIDFLLQKGWIIHPNTILTYNSTLVNTTF